HSASFGSLDGSKLPDANLRMSSIFRRSGIPGWFIEKAINTRSNDMWYPSSRELVSSKVAHRVLNANDLSRILNLEE
ncbi:MAG: hypothetical protein ACR2PH_04025, partial [Desulfobulbia bacterium]